MVEVSDKALRDRERAGRLDWPDLEILWDEIQSDDARGWDSGKALEHLVVRGFALSGLQVEYPYDVPLAGRSLEQIDGMVYLGDVPFLIECKDRDSADIEVIAKLRNQLLRRPPSTMGCVFVSGKFSHPALVLSNYAVPHRITLWSSPDITKAIQARSFARVLKQKYRELCMLGLTEHSPFRRRRARDVDNQ